MQLFGPPNFSSLGSRILIVHGLEPPSVSGQTRLLALASKVRDEPGVLECVPAMNNVTLYVDDNVLALSALRERICAIWPSLDATYSGGASHRVRVTYGGRGGCDLEHVATHAGLSVEDVIEIHSRGEYVVYFMGFQPGFAYLGGLDPRLHVPRRSAPRARVEPGSVAIGGAMTGIYPFVSPGGWNVIGRTDLALFDPTRDPPSLLSAGDRVRFVPC